MTKERHNPEKKQNNYGGDYDCPNYDTAGLDNREFCHDEGQVGWHEWIMWSQADNDGKLLCKGNRHNCFSMRQKWLASLPKDKREGILKQVT